MYVDHCQTAEDVRKQAAINVERRKKAFGPAPNGDLKTVNALIKAIMAGKRVAIIEELPEPPPAPEPVVEAAPEPKPPEPFSPKGFGPLRQLQELVAYTFAVPLESILTHRRNSSAIVARQVFFMLAMTLTQATSAQVGKATGDRDHSTVHFASRKYRWLRDLVGAELDRSAAPALWVSKCYELLKSKGHI